MVLFCVPKDDRNSLTHTVRSTPLDLGFNILQISSVQPRAPVHEVQLTHKSRIPGFLENHFSKGLC